MRALIVCTLLANWLIFSACNSKYPYPVAGVKVSYPNLSTTSTLKAVRVDKNNPSLIIDTLSIGELTSSNKYSLFVEFENDALNYILFVENTPYIDTISDIVIERKGNKEKVKTFEYMLNGQARTDTELSIY